MKSDLVDVTVMVRAERPAAVLVDHGGEHAVWLPKSQIDMAMNDDLRTFTCTLPEWLALEKGMI